MAAVPTMGINPEMRELGRAPESSKAWRVSRVAEALIEGVTGFIMRHVNIDIGGLKALNW
jgi:hypothetical protein